MNTRKLYMTAIRLYPRTPYLEESAVRHARRKWIASMLYLKHVSNRGWILDNPLKYDIFRH
jgi:hypothetical protein